MYILALHLLSFIDTEMNHKAEIIFYPTHIQKSLQLVSWRRKSQGVISNDTDLVIQDPLPTWINFNPSMDK